MNAKVPVLDVRNTPDGIDRLEATAEEGREAIERQDEDIADIAVELESQIQRSEQLRWIVRWLIVVVVGLIILTGVLFYMNHSLTELIGQLIDAMEQVASGVVATPTAAQLFMV